MNAHLPSPQRDRTVPGRSLRPLRRAAGIPVRHLARATGVREATVYNWEAGRARIPGDAVPGLARALGVCPRALPDLLRTRLELPAPDPVPPLRRLRRRTGLSQDAVARQVGAARHTVGAWEAGSPPPLGMLRRLAVTYGVPVATVAAAAGVTPPRELDRHRWVAGDLPAVLRTLRQWGGLTQRQLAERLGCTSSSVRNWEAGRDVPGRRNRALLERLYTLPAGDLLRAYPAAWSSAGRAEKVQAMASS